MSDICKNAINILLAKSYIMALYLLNDSPLILMKGFPKCKNAEKKYIYANYC